VAIKEMLVSRTAASTDLNGVQETPDWSGMESNALIREVSPEPICVLARSACSAVESGALQGHLRYYAKLS
jgi:hypothetical protein